MVVDLDYVLEHGDPRVEDYPLMQTPTITVVISIVYCNIYSYLSLIWIYDKKPFDLRKWMIIHNFLLVLINFWVFIQVATLWIYDYNWTCEPTDFSTNDKAIKAVVVSYVFYLTKFIELFDTLFLVLRKKEEQLSCLHIFHHAIVPITSWFYVKYGAGGYSTIYPLLNSFVHTWMYLYYGLAAVGPSLHKYLFWKKYLTLLQMFQFVVAVIFYTRILLSPPENCNASNLMIWMFMGISIIFLILFANFYSSSYRKKTDFQKSANCKKQN